MPERIVTTSIFWEQESGAPRRHLHAPLDIAIPRIVVIAGGEEENPHGCERFWEQANGDLLRSWMCVTSGDIRRPEGVHLLTLPTETAGDVSGMSRPGILRQFPDVRLIVLLGAEAHRAILRGKNKSTPEETVRAYDEFLPFFPLPDPSVTSREWMRSHPWFEQTILQILRRCVALALEKGKL